MQQLGFTFYPKDWWTSDTFFLLSPFERYVFLELLFMMYSNGGHVPNNKAMVEGRLRTTIKDEVWSKITDLLVEDGDKLTHKSVNKRLSKVLANRENGKKGGAPKGNQNASKQPKQPNKTTQNNPPYKKKENRKEIEIESEENSHARTHEVVPDLEEKKQSPWLTYPIDGMVSELKNSTAWKESVCMQYQLQPNEVDPWIDRFAGHLKASGEETKNLRDAKKHFSSWLRIQIDMQKRNGSITQNSTENAWRFDRTTKPPFPGDWVWLEQTSRWADREKMSNSEKRRFGL